MCPWHAAAVEAVDAKVVDILRTVVLLAYVNDGMPELVSGCVDPASAYASYGEEVGTCRRTNAPFASEGVITLKEGSTSLVSSSSGTLGSYRDRKLT